jgi:hypothetical protein
MDTNVSLYISVIFILLTLFLVYFFIKGLKQALDKSEYNESKRKKIMVTVTSIIAGWLALLAIVSFTGFFLDFMSLPPRIMFAIVPPLIIILLFVFSGWLDKLLLSLPSSWLITPQCFRILMEIILWLLFIENIIPIQMTFEGYNFDVIVGLTAPIISYLCFSQNRPLKTLAIVWNIIGLLVLINIVVIANISTPSTLRVFMNEPANTIIGYFPFIWLPGFVVPMALFMHLASLRQLVLKNKIA